MKIQPARLDQILQAHDGRMVLIDADVGGVAADLRAIDPCLKVRFAEEAREPCWIVFWESEDGRTTYLVTTAQAYLSASGMWTGLDQRIVDRIRMIDPQGRGGYDYAAEIQRQNEQAARDAKHRRMEMLGELGERAAHAVRKDVGSTARAFVPRDVA